MKGKEMYICMICDQPKKDDNQVMKPYFRVTKNCTTGAVCPSCAAKMSKAGIKTIRKYNKQMKGE
jgi:hypothetical protein